MANQLGKFTPNLAELTQPLRDLLSKSKSWMWGTPQSTAFKRIKEELSKPTTLALYDPSAPTKISADASAYGLGAVLLQKFDSWKPVAYVSRSMSETERRYAQIEKEALATTWASEKFADFIVGKHIEIETGHKPLVPLLGMKNLDCLPPRVLRFRLRLDRFSYDIKHVPGKELYTADALSRAPLADQDVQSTSSHCDLAEANVLSTISYLPASDQKLKLYKQAQSNDPICQQVLKFCRDGWPADKKNLDLTLKPYWDAQRELTEGDGLLMYCQRIVVPKALQDKALEKLHAGHQGIVRSKLRAKISVWWPGLTRCLTSFVSSCPECARVAKQPKEPLIPSPLPNYPWQRVAADLFHLKGEEYIVVVDYFSRFPEVKKLKATTSQSIINVLKTMFSRYGIPEELRSDNGPQFSSQEFAEFAKKYQFTHSTSSPHFPASNGQAERAVQTVKNLLKNSSDPFLALLSYRATPIPWCGRSPAELLMGRKIRTTLPMSTDNLTPQWCYLSDFKEADKRYKSKLKRNYDHRHRVRDLPEIPDNTDVWITTGGQPVVGQTSNMAHTPRSYNVQTSSGVVRRNRAHLNVVPPNPSHMQNAPQPNSQSGRGPIMTRSRTGTVVNPPERLA